MTAFPCPVGCGAGPYSTKNGAVMHAINKTDGEHDSVENKTEAYDRLEGVQNQEAAEEPEGSTEDVSEPTPEATTGPEFPEAPDGPNSDPLTPDEPLETEEPEGPEETEADDGDDEPEPDTEATASAAPMVLLVLAVGGLAVLLGSRGGSQTDDEPAYGVV